MHEFAHGSMSLDASIRQIARREIRVRTLGLCVLLLAAVAVLSPATSEARTVSVQTKSGHTMHLRTMMVGGRMMILVPLGAACDVFHGMSRGC
jgi:hypothetical protein